jgi:hypothetical protein
MRTQNTMHDHFNLQSQKVTPRRTVCEEKIQSQKSHHSILKSFIASEVPIPENNEHMKTNTPSTQLDILEVFHRR